MAGVFGRHMAKIVSGLPFPTLGTGRRKRQPNGLSLLSAIQDSI